MSRKRKTITVDEIREDVNRRNRESTCDRSARMGWNCLLEEILHITGNYAGYTHLEAHQVPAGELPGVQRGKDNGWEHPDDSRRMYI